MKKLIMILLGASILISIIGCQKKESNPPTNNTNIDDSSIMDNKVNSPMIPESAALGLIDLLDNALIHGKPFFDQQKFQNLEMDGKKVSIYANLFPYKPDFYEVLWTGVDTIQNEEALKFDLSMYHKIETDFDYNIIQLAVTQKGRKDQWREYVRVPSRTGGQSFPGILAI